MAGDIRPKLSIDEQLNHLISKGTRFDEKFTKAAARAYLYENNNYFRLRAYRKNYTKIPFGPQAGQYENLDFAHLVDLAIIDLRLRNVVLEMCLNIEHFAKVKLLRLISESNEDGYSIVTDYFVSQKPKSSTDNDFSARLQEDINRNCNSVYCGDLIGKYSGEYPVWVLVEIISFGSFIDFYRFCAMRLKNNEMQKIFSMLMEVKSLRNAAAHNNCIINDLCNKDETARIQFQVATELGKLKGISKQKRDTKMKNPGIRQIVTLLYTHKVVVNSSGVHNHICERLNELADRLFRDFDYSSNLTINTTFEFLKIIIDNWYTVEVS